MATIGTNCDAGVADLNCRTDSRAQIGSRDFSSKAALESWAFLVPMTFPKFVGVRAAMEHELRKLGTGFAGDDRL